MFEAVAFIVIPVLVASISGPLMWALRRMDERRNVADERNHEVLVEIRDTIRNTNSRLDDHLQWHGTIGWEAAP